jgi:hypothetical protein
MCVDDDLVRAWGPPGPWTEAAGGVYAPEEVRRVGNVVKPLT